MKKKEDYSIKERVELTDKYRKKGCFCTGTTSGLKWYRRGLAYAEKGHDYDQKNYQYYYHFQEHCESYSRKGLQLFEKAATCFKRAAELGNDLAIMNYALYLYAFKEQNAEALVLFQKASDLGLAVADYQLYVFYKNGYCDLEIDEEKAAFYLERFQKRTSEDERQLILAWDVDLDSGVLGRGYMFSWFHGFSFCETYDTPSARPSEWKYKHYCF